MPYTQENRLIGIETPLGKDILLLRGFSGQEGISRSLEFRSGSALARSRYQIRGYYRQARHAPGHARLGEETILQRVHQPLHADRQRPGAGQLSGDHGALDSGSSRGPRTVESFRRKPSRISSSKFLKTWDSQIISCSCRAASNRATTASSIGKPISISCRV
jgi:hypothetical protein